MDERLREIRKLLLGQTQRMQDGSIMAVQTSGHRNGRRFQGVSTGWGAIHFLGITHRTRSCALRTAISHETLSNIMKTQGRIVHLEKSPKTLACLVQRPATKPVLITLQWDGKRFLITAYTARGIFAPLTCRIMLGVFGKKLPGTMEKYQDKTRKNKRSAGKKKQPQSTTKKKSKNTTQKDSRNGMRSRKKKR